ncbi:MAG: hypothetical protein Q8P01_02970 [bacterium]|nr:hypothetical protein [bacterium]
MNKHFVLNPKVRIASKTSGKHHFFGFHDLCPWDASGKYMLAMETDFIDRPPRADDVAKICLIDVGKNTLEILTETRAWNFQEGSRVQWLPNEPEKIMYNDYDNNHDKFVSVALNVKSREKRMFSYPIYAVSPDGDIALGLNFTRLQKYGGYGYAQKLPITNYQLSNIDEPSPQNDGIFRVDFKTGEAKLIISIHAIAHLNNSPKENEHHILTHIAFNPSGTRICFIDKYKLPDGGFMQRLITANPDGTDAYVLPGHVSHFDWKSDAEIFAYGKFSPKITALRGKGIFQNQILKPFLNIGRKMRGILKQKIAGQSYLLLADKTQNVKRIGVGLMTEDGHPQFSPDGKWVIADTYPDKNHERTLMLYDWASKKRIDIGKFKSLPEGFPETWDTSEMRSDLHPRWNRSGTAVCVDSVHEGTRQMYVLDVQNAVLL